MGRKGGGRSLGVARTKTTRRGTREALCEPGTGGVDLVVAGGCLCVWVVGVHMNL